MPNLKHISRLGSIYWTYAVKKAVRTKYLPYRLWIEPTSRCNLKCLMCPNKDLEAEQVGMMDLELFRKIIEEARHFVHDVNIHHRGESLLHKNIFDMIKFAKANGIVLKLHTNATVLNENIATGILDSGLDYISFSFDGLNKETYERYRVGAQYEKTIQNIIGFLNVKKKYKKQKPLAVLELMDFQKNDESYDLGTLSDFRKQFHGLPLNLLIVKKPHNFAGNVDLNTTIGKTAYSPCTFLWHSLVILWNGDVSPCTQDFHGDIILGNVRENSLEELFNGDKIISLRESAIKGEMENFGPCSACDMIKRRRVLGIPVNSLRYLEK